MSSQDEKLVKVSPVPAEDEEVKKKDYDDGGSAPLSKPVGGVTNEEDSMIKEQVEILCRQVCYPATVSADRLHEETAIASALATLGEILRNPAYFTDSSSVVKNSKSAKKEEHALSTNKAGGTVGSVPKPLKHIRAYFMLLEESGLVACIRRSPVFAPYFPTAPAPNTPLARDEVKQYILACCTEAEAASVRRLKEGTWEHQNELNRRAFHDLLSFIAMTIQFNPLTDKERGDMVRVKDRLYKTSNATAEEEGARDVEEEAKKQAELKKLTIHHDSVFFPTLSFLFSDSELEAATEGDDAAVAAEEAASKSTADAEAEKKDAAEASEGNKAKVEAPVRHLIRVSLYHKLCGSHIRCDTSSTAGFGLWFDAKTVEWGHEFLRTLAGEVSKEWHFLTQQKERLEEDGATLPPIFSNNNDGGEQLVTDEEIDMQYIAAFGLAMEHQRYYTTDPAAASKYVSGNGTETVATANTKFGPQGFTKVSYLSIDGSKTPSILPTTVNKALRQLRVAPGTITQASSVSPLVAIRSICGVLVKIASSILYFTLVQHHDESTAVDLAIEIGKPELLLDYCHNYFTTPHQNREVDTSKHNNSFDRAAQYLLACAQYLPLTSDRTKAMYVAFRLYRRHMMFIPAANTLLQLLPFVTPASAANEPIATVPEEDGEPEDDMDPESKNNTIYLPLASLFRLMMKVDFYYFLFAKAHEENGSFNHKEAVQHAGFFTLSSASTLTRDSMLQIALVCARHSIFMDFSQMLSSHFLPASQLAQLAKLVVSFVQCSCPQGTPLSSAMLPLFNGLPVEATRNVAAAYRECIADPLVNEVLQPENNNSRRSEYFRHAAAELDSLAPKHPEEEVFKNKNKSDAADVATIDSSSYMHNLSLAFVNGLVNCGFGTDKIIAAEQSGAAGSNNNNVSFFYKTKDHRRLSSAASLGLIHLWGLSSTSAAGGASAEGAVDEVKDGLSVVDQYTYSEDPFIQAGAALATGILCCNTASPFDPALSLLSDKVTPSTDGTTETNHYVRIASILGLGLAYAGQHRQDVKELLIPLIIENSFSGNNSNIAMKSNCFEIQAFAAIALAMVFAGSRDDDISEAIVTCLLEHGDDGAGDAEVDDDADSSTPTNNLFLVSHPATVYLILALGSLFLGSREGGNGIDLTKKRNKVSAEVPGAMEAESDEEEEGNNLEVLLEATKALSPGIQLFTEITVTACAYAGSGNVLQIQRMFNLILEDEDDDEDEAPANGEAEGADTKKPANKKAVLNYKSAAVLAIGMIAMGTEEIGVDMAKRSLIHILLADHVSKGTAAEGADGAAASAAAAPAATPFMSGRSAVPLAYSLLSLSNPAMPVVETLHKLSHDNFFATSAGAASRRGGAAAASVSTTAMNAILGMGLVSAGSNNARVAAMLRSLASYYGSASQSSTAANTNSLLWMVRIAQGLTSMGKGHAYLSPVHTDRSLVSAPGLVGILAVMFSCLDVFDSSAAGGSAGFLSILSASASGSGPIRTLLDRYHFMLYMITPAIAPRALITVSTSTSHGKTLSAEANTSKTTNKADAEIDGAAAAPTAHKYFNDAHYVSYINCQARTGTPVDSVTIPGKKPKRITGFTTNNTPTLTMPTEERSEIVSNYAHFQKPQSSGMAHSAASGKATTSKVLATVSASKEPKEAATTGYRVLPGSVAEGIVVVEKLFYKQILYEVDEE